MGRWLCGCKVPTVRLSTAFEGNTLTKFEFLSAQVLSRLLVTLTASVIVFIGTNLMLDYKMVGSIALLLLNRFDRWLSDDYIGLGDCV